MTPAQERVKLDAERKANRKHYAEEKFAASKCVNCNGRGWGTAGRFPTLTTCPVCNGSGRKE